MNNEEEISFPINTFKKVLIMNKYELPKKLKVISTYLLLATAPVLFATNVLAGPPPHRVTQTLY